MDRSVPDIRLYNTPFVVEDFRKMPFRYLGKSGLKVSNMGLGTWKMGYPETGDSSRTNEKQSLEILDRAVELGVTFWDTANRYNNASGNSERIIGNWFRNNPNDRRNVILATKMAGTMDGLTPNHCGLSRTNILESVYASLERLQSEYIDLLYFHAFDPHTPPEESLLAIEDLVRQDLIRYFAVSNFSIEQLELYGSVQGSLSARSRILAVQNQYNVLDGESSACKGVLDYAANTGLSFIAWSPMARGLLTGRYLNGNAVGPGDRLFDEGEAGNTNPAHLKKLQNLAVLSREWDFELSQVVIAYMLSLPGMGPVIAASSNIKQVESNAMAGKIMLTELQKSLVREVLNG